MSAQICGPASAYSTVILVLLFLTAYCHTRLQYLFTSDDITLQQRMTAFILFTSGSLQKRPQPQINLISTLGRAVHTLCVALI